MTLSTPIAVERPSLEERWLSLWMNAARPSPNANPGRCLATARALGTAPEVLEIGEDCLIVGRREVGRVTHRIGYLPVRTPRLRTFTVVYGGVLGHAEPDAIADRLFGLLRGPDRVERVLINRLDSGPLLDALTRRRGVVVQSAEPHWIAEPAGVSFDEAMARHSSKTRGKLRRYERILRDHFGGDVSTRVFERPTDVGPFLEMCEGIASTTYQAALGYGVRDTPLWRELLTHAASAGLMRSFALIAQGRPIAYQNGLLLGDRYWCDGKGYLPECAEHRPGTMLYLQMLRDLCERGVTEIDFGFGDADYKHTFGDRHWTESTVNIYARSVRARLGLMVDAGARRGGEFAQRVGAPVGRRVKSWWRRRLRRDAE